MKNVENLKDFYTKPDEKQRKDIKIAIERVAEAKGDDIGAVKRALKDLNLDVKGVRVFPGEEDFVIETSNIGLMIKGTKGNGDSLAVGMPSRTARVLDTDSINIIGSVGSKMSLFDLQNQKQRSLSVEGGENVPGYMMAAVPEMVRFKGERKQALDIYNFSSADAVYKFKESSDSHKLVF